MMSSTKVLPFGGSKRGEGVQYFDGIHHVLLYVDKQGFSCLSQ